MRQGIYRIALACSILFAQVSALRAQNTMAALNRAEATYRGIETLRAEFTQTLINPMLGGSVVSTGTIFLAPPSRFAMRFTDPHGDRIVSDGSWLWIYLPSSVPNQVLRQPIPSRGAATPNLLAQFVDRPLEHYRASYVGIDSVVGVLVDVVNLVPRRADDPFTQAEVAIERATGFVRRLAVNEPAGQRRIFLFERLQRNVEIPESELSFSVPTGARIITPL
jgi:outer membrane lipoprotein carrier protein